MSTNALRVAVVTETYPPEVNGVAATVHQLVRGLAEAGHAIALVRPRQDDSLATAPASIVEDLVRGAPLPRYPGLRFGLPCAQRLKRRWRLVRPDIVHIATEGPLGWSALSAARSLGLPVVSDFRTNFHLYIAHYGAAFLQRAITAYLRRFHNACARTLVPTAALAADLDRLGFRRLEAIARGVDTGLFEPARRSEELRRSWGVDPRTPVALHVGRLAPEKNLDALFATHTALRRAVPELRLVLVGDGPCRAAIAQRHPEVILAGTRRDVDLATHYASADLFVFPSQSETFGNVVPEAMASGLPVLAYDYAAAAKLIRHGDNGLVAPVGAEGRFIELAMLLADQPALRRRLGALARETALAHGWSGIVQQTVAVYRSVIAERTTGPAALRIAAAH